MAHNCLKISEILWFVLIKLIKLNMFGCEIKKHGANQGKKEFKIGKIFIKILLNKFDK